MKKQFFLFFTLFSLLISATAQKPDLVIKSGDKGLYLDHKVAPKESFYSVGRLYNVHPKSIALFNKLDMNKGLQIDQKLRIPLTDTNFTQQGNTGTPVYYKAGEKLTLAKVSKANNNVPLSSLRTWNNISSEEVKEGAKLVIGFLKSKEMPSVTLNFSNVIKETPDKPETKPEEKPEVKPETKPEITAPKVEPKPVEKTEPQPIVNTPPKTVVNPEIKASNNDQGYFKSHFEQQAKTTPVSKDLTVTSSIFKTTSGWQDGKYYLLIDGVQPGFIVRVINPTNNKVIYAKVLGAMSGIRQNEGLNIRISNAAASLLEIGEQDKFIVRVNY
jgi:LysM repeat protein